MKRKASTEDDLDQLLVKRFGQLIPDTQLLDAWLIWMEDACGRFTGGGGTRNLPFVNGPSTLPSVGMCFGEDGDDGTLLKTGQFLCDVVASVTNTVAAWAVPMTEDAQRTFSRRLFKLEIPPSIIDTSWRSLEFRSASSLPTAHEATCVWLKRFCELFEPLTSPAAALNDDLMKPSQRMNSTLFFACLTWNTRYAADLLAAMEQERRWIHYRNAQQLNPTASPVDGYLNVWRPLDDSWIKAQREVDHLPVLQREIIQALRPGAFPTKKRLFRQTSGSTSQPSGAFNSSLEELIVRGWINSGGAGRGSSGYRLTPLGTYVADLLKLRKQR